MSSSVLMQVMMRREWEEERAKGRGGRDGCGALAGDISSYPVKFLFHSLHVAASAWSEVTSPLHMDGLREHEAPL